MKTLEKGQEKIQKICDSLRRETLEPAKREAERIVEDAKAEARNIVREAEEQAERLNATVRAEIDQERNVFKSSLLQAAKQSLESLRQDIERKLFRGGLEELVERETEKGHVVARLVEAIVKAVEKEGVKSDLEALVPKTVKPEEVNALLGGEILKRLKKGSVEVGEFAGGCKVKLLDRKMTLEVTDAVLKELLASFARKDFRKTIFETE